jgi:ABC-type Fe3+ transport system substrate-binding protein
MDLQILWRPGSDALSYLRGPGVGIVDVHWSSAVRNFHTLAAENLLSATHLDRKCLPGAIGKQLQSDPQGRFEAVETAGYGIVFSDAYLAAQGLPIPTQFHDLAQPCYEGHVALPVPSRIGFAPPIYEHWLQTYGWQHGFELILRTAANARLVGLTGTGRNAGSGVVELVGRGEVGVGLSTDFFAQQAAAQGMTVGLVYPDNTLFSPARIGILRSAPNRGAARLFVDFLLSDGGQRVLFEPSVGRLPLRTTAYRNAPTGTFDPFTMSGVTVPHDITLGLIRQPIVAALYDAAITDKHEQLKAVWRMIRTVEKDGNLDVALLAKARAQTATEQCRPIPDDDECQVPGSSIARRATLAQHQLVVL